MARLLPVALLAVIVVAKVALSVKIPKRFCQSFGLIGVSASFFVRKGTSLLCCNVEKVVFIADDSKTITKKADCLHVCVQCLPSSTENLTIDV